MTRSRHFWKKLILFSTLLLLLAGFYALTQLLPCTASLPNRDRKIFSITPAMVYSITITDEETHTQTIVTERDEIEPVVAVLNELRYDSYEALPFYLVKCDTESLEALFS